VIAILNAIEPADLDDALPPARRQRADMLKHWAAIAEPRKAERRKAGVLRELRRPAGVGQALRTGRAAPPR
jgi:hypothetical protein